MANSQSKRWLQFGALGLAVLVVLIAFRFPHLLRLKTDSPIPPGKETVDAKALTGFPYELAAGPGNEALAALTQLQRQGGKEGFIPVILGDGEDVSRLMEAMEFAADEPEAIIKKAEAIDIQTWLTERIQEDPQYYQAELGTWPFLTSPQKTIYAIRDILTMKPKKTVYIAKVPAKHSWEIPAYLKLGSWNECPEAEVQIAASRYWYNKYGAEIIAVTPDTVEYGVTKPPSDRSASLSLAREQFVYCTDLVYQGCDSLNGLAATLCRARYWYFWWD